MVEERGGGGGRWRASGPTAATPGICEAIARELAPLRLEDRETQRSLADEVRLFDVLGVDDTASLDVEPRWRARPHREELRVALGVDSDGERVDLDLKQAADGGMGPHGLIVGATGSGKSELLRTLVAGAGRSTTRPRRSRFVLIDYKGGAAFAELADAPAHRAA